MTRNNSKTKGTFKDLLANEESATGHGKDSSSRNSNSASLVNGGQSLLPSSSKSKSTKKSSERRFLSFTQRLKQMNINSIQSLNDHSQYILSKQKAEDDATTYTSDVMRYWQANNKTSHYQYIHRKMVRYVRTMQDLIFYKDQILSLLKSELKSLRKDSYEAILDIVWILARELREEFVKDFLPHLFEPLISKIDLKESDMMETVFRTLMLLFRFLYPYMIQDMEVYFLPYENLLSHKNVYVRSFAAESFAFLLQKMNREEHRKENSSQAATTTVDGGSALMSFLDVIFHQLHAKNSEAFYDGVSLLFFNAIKAVMGNFKKGVNHFLSVLFTKYFQSITELASTSDNTKQMQNISAFFLLLKKLLKKLVSHAQSKDVAKTLWKTLQNHVEQCKTLPSTAHSSGDSTFQIAMKHNTGFVLTLLGNPSKLDEKILSDLLAYLLSKDIMSNLTDESFLQLVKIVEILNQRYGGEKLRQTFSRVEWENLLTHQRPTLVYQLFISFAAHGVDVSLFSGETIVGFAEKYFSKKFLSREASNSTVLDTSISFLLAYSAKSQLTLTPKMESALQKIIVKEFDQVYSQKSSQERTRLLGALSLWNTVTSMDKHQTQGSQYNQRLSTLFSFMETTYPTQKSDAHSLSLPQIHGNITSEQQAYFEQDQLVAAQLVRSLEFSHFADAAFLVSKLFLAFGTHHDLIHNIHYYFDTCSRRSNLSQDVFLQQTANLSEEKIMQSSSLYLNLSSFNDQTRLNTLRMLVNCGFSNEFEKKILKCMIRSEEYGQDFHKMRDRLAETQRIIAVISSRELRAHFVRLVLVWQLGAMWMKLNLSEMNSQLLDAIAEKHGDIFWEIMHPQVLRCFQSFQKEREFDLAHKDDENPIIYENKSDQSALRITFSAYHDFFNIPVDLFDLKLSVRPDSFTGHVTVTQYFNMLWKDFISKGSLIENHPQDFVSLFDLFYSHFFKDLEQYRIKRIGEKTFVGQFLLDFVVAFSNLDVDHVRLYEQFWMSIVCTTHSQIQIATIQLLKLIDYPWLTPHIDIIMKVVKSRSSTKPLEKFSIKSLPEQHQEPLLRFLTRATLPLLNTRKSQEKSKRKQHEAIIRFLGKCKEKHVIAAILEELFYPLFTVKDQETLTLPSLERIMEHPDELKRAFSITGSIVKHSFSSSGFLAYLDEILRLISAPLFKKCAEYKQQVASAAHDADQMRDEDDASETMEDEENDIQQDEDPELATDDDNQDSLNYFAQESQRLTLLAFRRYPDVSYSKQLLTFHMDNSSFVFRELLPLYPQKLPSLARVSFAFFSLAPLSGALFYDGFLEHFLKALSESRAETAKILVTVLRDLVNIQDAIMSHHTYNLFSSELEVDSPPSVGEYIIQPNIGPIMTALYCVASQSSNDIVIECISMAKKLSSYFTDSTPADAVLFFFGVSIPKDASMEDKEVVEVLNIFKRFIPLASAEVQVKFITYISNLLLNSKDGSIRMAVCEIFEQIARTVADISPVAKLLYALEARDKGKVSDEDIQQQLSAIKEITTSTYASFTDVQWMPICASLLYKLTKSKIEVKEACASALESILKRIPESSSAELIESTVLSVVSSHQITTGCIQVKLLLSLSTFCSDYSALKDSLPVEFYELLASASTRSKAQALEIFSNRFTSWYRKNKQCSRLVLEVFLPMFLRLLKANLDPADPLVATCPQLFITLCAAVDKPTYKEIYAKLLRHLTAKDTTENNSITSILVSISRRFTGEKIENTNSSMATFFMETVVKQLRSSVFAKKGHMQLPRIELARLIVEIVSTFAERHDRHNIINKIIRDLITKLNSKENLQRNKTREVLISIVKMIGNDRYLSLAVRSASHLLVDGFQRDVFLKTTFDLLSMAVQPENSIPIDSSIEVLQRTLFRDIKKEEEKISTMGKVDKKQDYNFGTIYDCIRIMGRGMKVSTSLGPLVEEVHALMKGVHQKNILQRFTNIYEQLVAGLSQNESLTDSFLIQFCLSKFDECSLYNTEFQFSRHQTQSKPRKRAKYAHLEILPEPTAKGYLAASSKTSAFVQGNADDLYLVRFLVHLIARGLKESNALNTESRGYSHLFHSLVKYASGRDEDLALASLQCLLTMRKRKVPIAVKNQDKIVEIILNLLKSSGIDTRSETWQVLFTSINYFMHKVKYQFPEAYQSLILEILQLELSSQREENANAFLLLKGMIDRRTMLPQMYDLAKQCRMVLITTMRSDIQSICVQILKNFLIYYPMEPEVLQEHLSFIFKNIMNPTLSIEAHQGLGEMILTIITRFPIEYLQQKVEFILCPVAVQICNEKNSESKEKLQEALLALLNRVDAASFSGVMKLVRKWTKSDKLSVVGFEVFKIASKVNNGSSVSNYLDDPKFKLWSRIAAKLESIPQNVEQIQLVAEKDTAVLFNVLSILGILFRQKLVKKSNVPLVYSSLRVLLVHPSVHVRDQTLQVIDAIFKKYSKSYRALTQESELTTLGLLLIENLLSKNFDDTAGHLVKKNFMHVFGSLIKKNSKSVASMDASDEGDAEVDYSQLLTGSHALSVLMKRIRSAYLQSNRTDDNASVKYLRIKCLVDTFETLATKYGDTAAPLVGFFTPTLYLLYEDAAEKDTEEAVLAENCINLLKKKLDEKFTESYSKGRSYILNRRAARKDTAAAEFLTDQKAFAQKKLLKRRRTKEARKEKRKKARLG